MQNTKKKTCSSTGNEDSKKKERHIVTWTQEVPFLPTLFHSPFLLFISYFWDWLLGGFLLFSNLSSLVDGFLTWVFLSYRRMIYYANKLVSMGLRSMSFFSNFFWGCLGMNRFSRENNSFSSFLMQLGNHCFKV